MGEITDNGWSEITEYGFEYSTDETFENGQGNKGTVAGANNERNFFGRS
jgi:hypothetical protein